MANSHSKNSLVDDGMLSLNHRYHGSSKDCDDTADYSSPKKKRIRTTKVDHTYLDLSKLPLDEAAVQLARKNNTTAEQHTTIVVAPAATAELGKYAPAAAVARSKKNLSFPRKLYEMVTNPDFQHIICFMPHGRSWVVLNKEALASEVLPKYFSHSKFESFNRQVNGWGFKRLLKRGPDHKSYYHECFLRGRPELTSLMIRLVNPGKRIPDRDHEPDFYDISSKAPLPDIVVPRMSSCPFKQVHAQVLKTPSKTKGVSPLPYGVPPPSRQPFHQVVTSPLSAQDPAEAFRMYQEFTKTSTLSHTNPWQVEATLPPFMNPSQSFHPPPSQRFHGMPVQVASSPNLACAELSPTPQMYPSNNSLELVIAAANMDPIPIQQQAAGTNQPAVDAPNSSDWLEEALPTAKPRMKRTPSFLSVESDSSGDSIETISILSNCDHSLYCLEPDPLLEDAPLKIRCDSHYKKFSLQERDPLLEAFAEIYFSKNGPSDIL